MSVFSPSLIISLVGAAAVLVVLGLFVRAVFFGYPKPALARSILSAKEQAIIAACADALFPSDGPIPISGTQAGLVAYMDAYIRRFPSGPRLLLRLLFQFIEHGPWLFGPRPARFTRLSPADRVRALEGMHKSRIYFRRVAFISMRAVLTMGYFANAEVARRVGCEPCASPFEGSTPRGPDAGERARGREVFA